MTDLPQDFPALAAEPLFVVHFEVEGGILAVGETPFGARRMGYVTGGRFEGARLKGEVLPGGGNWSLTGRIAPDLTAGTFDARVVLRTDDGALIYMTYTGRSVVSDAVAAAFRDPTAPETPFSDYALRIAPVFETADPRYLWLNGVLAVGCGRRLEGGVRHSVFAIL
jgi:hypothetical protein